MRAEIPLPRVSSKFLSCQKAIHIWTSLLQLKMKKGGVMQLRHARGCHMVFWEPIQPLQRVPRLACSVASLSWYPGHQLLKCYSLHCKTLTGYLLGKELPSAYTVTHSMQHCIPAPQVTAEPKMNHMSHGEHMRTMLPRAMLKLPGLSRPMNKPTSACKTSRPTQPSLRKGQ